MADVAGWSLFGKEVVVILRHSGFEHGRPELRSVAQVLGPGVIGQKAQACCIAAAQVHVAAVIPASRGILQYVDTAYPERGTRHRRDFWKNRAIFESRGLIRPAGLDEARSRQRVIDQMCACQVETAGTLIAEFQRHVFANGLFDRRAPLLNILRRSVGVERREADNSLTEHRRTEVESRDRRNEVIALVGFRKNSWHVMHLVAPVVHVYRRVEDAVGGTHH